MCYACRWIKEEVEVEVEKEIIVKDIRTAPSQRGRQPPSFLVCWVYGYRREKETETANAKETSSAPMAQDQAVTAISTMPRLARASSAHSLPTSSVTRRIPAGRAAQVLAGVHLAWAGSGARTARLP